ncbi:hypothetical protein [Streptomyces boninensis]|uniref:hypothetical protein n=1 Tax=Streptomyces boninensis TaxID=2039455 RepID=UPI003B2162CF
MLVGRSAEYGQLDLLLRSAPRVTVVGPGGIGKSALAGAYGLAAEAAGGRVVRLDLAAPGAAEALAAPGAADVLMGARTGGELLLLESCENALDACAEVLAELDDAGAAAGAVAGARVLATSRCPLPGSINLHLGPLERPDAVGLFARHARRHGTDVAATAQSRTLADDICALLEDEPLALVLAAAQLPHTPLNSLAARLIDAGECLALTSEAPDVPPRHRSVRRCLGWSHQLCTADERLLWARLSVFPDSFTAAAAWRVCADERLRGGVLTAALEGLHRQSVVQSVGGGRPGTWYRMPRTVRAYGSEWLLRLGEERTFRRRCLEWSMGTADLDPS